MRLPCLTSSSTMASASKMGTPSASTEMAGLFGFSPGLPFHSLSRLTWKTGCTLTVFGRSSLYAVAMCLAACVPPVASWSLSTLPKALPPAQVKQVLADARKRRSPVARRDYAILLLLARLGLRGGEVCHLVLEDLDWENSRISIRGKGGRVTQLPLPADVGQAIAAYLQHNRPRVSDARRLFLRGRAPLAGFKGQRSVGSVVERALHRAKIDSPRKGTHQFRHSLASAMLQQGSSLSEIGELLRHRSPNTTAIYAKVDLHSLRSLALPWPGGAS